MGGIINTQERYYPAGHGDFFSGKSQVQNPQDDKKYMDAIREKKEEILEKVRRGETEPSIPLGAVSFTQKQWNKLMKNVDRAIDDMQERIHREEEVQEKKIKKKKENSITREMLAQLLGDMSASEKSKFPIETERYVIEDAGYIEKAAAYVIKDKQTGKGLYIREDQLVIQKDEKTGLGFIINMDQPFSENVMITDELRDALSDLAGMRNFDLKEVPLQGGLTVNQDPKTGLRYLSIKGNEGKGVSVIIASEQDNQILNKLTEEFMQYSVCSQRETAGLYALLEISGNLKRGEEGMTILSPDGISYVPYDGNPGKAWYIKLPASGYAKAREYLAAESEILDYRTWLDMIPNAKLSDGSENPYAHRGEDSETKSDVIVKPDGSKVLVMTLKTGGIETSVSVEIAKPTGLIDDNDTNMGIVQSFLILDR